jgi:transcriptional regulator with XRE-family HTH domain
MSALDNLKGHVRAYIKEHKVTQVAIAKRAGLSGPWLSQVLSGTRGSPVPTLEKFAAGIGYELWQLFTIPGSQRAILNSPDASAETESALTKIPGSDIEQIDPNRPPEQLAQLQAENDELRGAFRKLTDIHKRALETIDQIGNAQGAPSADGQSSRSDDRSVPGTDKRHKGGEQ